MPNIKTSSFYDLEDLSENETKSLGVELLRKLLLEAKYKQKELNSEYINGDSFFYPPDWYDHYVFPIDCIINKIEDIIASLNKEEESSYEEY